MNLEQQIEVNLSDDEPEVTYEPVLSPKELEKKLLEAEQAEQEKEARNFNIIEAKMLTMELEKIIKD